MIRSKLTISILLFFIAGAIVVAEEYDRGSVVEVMRNNIRIMGELGEAVQNEDYFRIGAKFFEISQGMLMILPFSPPPSGSEEDWKKTITEFVLTAYKGVGAAGERDIMAVRAAFDRLKALNRQGHMDHRS